MRLGVTVIEVTQAPIHENIAEIQNGIYPTGSWAVLKRSAAEKLFVNDYSGQDSVLMERELFRGIFGESVS